jgi:hypothetical protein
MLLCSSLRVPLNRLSRKELRAFTLESERLAETDSEARVQELKLRFERFLEPG